MLRGECHEAEASEASLTIDAAVSSHCQSQHPGFTARLQQSPLPLDPAVSRHRLVTGLVFRLVSVSESISTITVAKMRQF
jgi:hypothetical protein